MLTLLKPRFWAMHLLALMLIGATGGLGIWQYDAWQTRRAVQASDLTMLDPVPLADVIGPDDPFPGDRVGQPVILDGTWVPGGTVFVAGREHDGDDGFWVVTPLAIGGPTAPALPVVRGWVRDPDLATASPTGPAKFVGWLQPPEGTGETDDDPADDVLPQLRIADVIQHVDQDLYGAYAVVADDVAAGAWSTGPTAVNDGTEGLVPADLAQLPTPGRFTALRNLLYAIEWWIFGAFAGFVWVQWVRESGREPGDEDGDPEGADAASRLGT